MFNENPSPEAGRALAGAVLVLTAGAAGAQPAGTTFRDCPECPEMVVVPSGSFLMNSSSGGSVMDPSSGELVGRWVSRRVTVPRPFAVGVYEVTRGQFARFVSATGRSMGDTCKTYEGGLKTRSGRHWRNPGFRFSQTDEHPVVCVSWSDAKAYVEWLSRVTGEGYRLPSDLEWEYAARGGTETSWGWGLSWESTAEGGRYVRCRYVQYVNGADGMVDCYEDFGQWVRWTEPVGSDSANGFGLYDMHRNVMEWRDWSEGRPHGGSWRDKPRGLLGSYRGGFLAEGRNSNVGFRVARTLTP